ncbi:ABC transporter CDR4 [Lasiosphaeris hirsuta]|uniref:ABC transporter CDR4 n=1 Tax=Lasiosphaeris hirsuta TaxID=260670 RepID=A0AA40DQ39_9PEZI|nr:ABC transporter CDR4 [Lasiosphaeris hirsuta]
MDVIEPSLEKGAAVSEKSKLGDAKTTNTTGSTSDLSVHVNPEPENPFSDVVRNPQLDPLNPAFNIRAWLANLTHFTSHHGATAYPHQQFGVCFRNLAVSGYGTPTDYQKTVSNSILSVSALFRWLSGSGARKIPILRDFEGLVQAGEMLLVLGRPGSGCSTLLKTISGDVHGLLVEEGSHLNYQGVPPDQMRAQFRGEAIYMAEHDVHFPQLTVNQTLSFAARARAPPDGIFPGVTRASFAERLKDVALAAFGLVQVANTNVGNELIKGVSGGERKRVSIAEAMLSGSSLQCWDNSTRGLDSANAIEFCKTLKVSAELAGAATFVALYQAPQAAYDAFDKVTLLYEGRQIYFGPSSEAAAYFEGLGFERAPRQTTPDFLTSVTSSERRIRVGSEKSVPKTPDDFVQRWKSSSASKSLGDDLQKFDETYPAGGPSVRQLLDAKHFRQTSTQNPESPYVLSFLQQVSLCVQRGFQRLRRDATITITGVVVNSLLALVVGSAFYDLDETTNSFYGRGVLIFLSLLLNAFASAMEILLLYAARPIVEKHVRYAFHHPSAEAMAGLVTDMPYKVGNAIFFNLVLYFMTNLRRTPAAFFTFLLFSFCTTLCMSHMYRTFGALSRTLVQALVPVALIILALILYTGFTTPVGSMVPWFGWIRFVNPIAYAFESLMVNEFWDRSFDCAAFVPQGPSYNNLDPLNHICSVVGAKTGLNFVSGEDYLRLSFGYEKAHQWRNFGILVAFTIFYLGTYIVAAEVISAKRSKGEVLVFRRGYGLMATASDVESSSEPSTKGSELATEVPDIPSIEKHTSVFHWRDICFDITVNKEKKRILDHVDGWIKPGTVTALIGPSGAGKTSLLDVLATRTTIGVVSGDVFVNGSLRDTSFQRKTGYAQQFDLHLATATVRESLQFSALMRQPASATKKEKLDYVEEVIKLLGMGEYAEAVVGIPGEGLNVEQRKRLTIGVELAARPQLLIFLDEPTSGLDSQTAWSILDLLTTLKQHGQAVLCTIHQPSAPLFQRFDRLLFLAPNGRPAYFGDIGAGCKTLTSYFERNGAKPCPGDGNPAEWLMETIGCAPGSHSDIDWPAVWRESSELDTMEANLSEKGQATATTTHNGPEYWEFAAPYHVQLWECTKRVNAQYWRSPSYIYSKIALTTLTSLFLGLAFYMSDNTIQGLQNQSFSIFMLLTIFPNFVPQILPNFVAQRDLYEARERPSKVYSWPVFLVSNMATELAWNTLMSVFMFVVWYYPIGFYRNATATDTVTERGALMFLLLWVFLMFTTTFGYLIQAAIETAEAAGNAASGLFTFWLVFCGVLVSPTAMPGFWKFMYYLSPFTYLVSAVLSVGLSQSEARCSDIELLSFDSGNGTCGAFMAPYITTQGGYLVDSRATGLCEYCPVEQTDVFLEFLGIRYADRWRNFGILWAYTVFNAAAAVLVYWLARVPKGSKKEGKVAVVKG